MTDYLAIARQALERMKAAEAIPAPGPGQQSKCEHTRMDPARFELKGRAVELWRHGQTYFLVADETDAKLAMARLGVIRGQVWTTEEVELVARMSDEATRDEVAAFKRRFNGTIAAIEPRPAAHPTRGRL